MISDIYQDDVSPILAVYPDLEILHIRGGRGLRFSQWRHEKLKALRIESGGLNRETLEDLNQLELPALEYLELWLGSPDYGGTSSINDLMPIISGEKFPKLKYLGLRNCEYTDDIAFELAKSPLMERLIELDLSMGTLSKEGLLCLANCQAINELDKLNIAGNYCYHSSRGYDYNKDSPQYQAMIQNCPELVNIKCELIMNEQRWPEQSKARYCAVRE